MTQATCSLMLDDSMALRYELFAKNTLRINACAILKKIITTFIYKRFFESVKLKALKT